MHQLPQLRLLLPILTTMPQSRNMAPPRNLSHRPPGHAASQTGRSGDPPRRRAGRTQNEWRTDRPRSATAASRASESIGCWNCTAYRKTTSATASATETGETS
ncbi:MAG: hypothetical protein U0787_05145 [Polyangia bacterium]